eukprot:SAG31_NODE_2586_length_5430_cov_2.815044_4_plen_111_part_00
MLTSDISTTVRAQMLGRLHTMTSSYVIGCLLFLILVAGWDGAALPIGLGLSLLINGCFFARHINRISAEENMITLPDLFAIRFGAAAEILASVVTLISFLFLLAGNLVGP